MQDPNNDELAAASPFRAPSTTQNQDQPNIGSPSPAERNPEPSEAAPMAPTGYRVPDRPAATEARPDATGPRRTSSFDYDIEVRRVRLDEIDGVDEDITQFLRDNDVLTEVSMQSDRWSQPMTTVAIHCHHMMLWQRRGRLVHLGSGRALTLARRLAHHDDLLPASIVLAKTLSLQQKLTYIAHELAFLPALHRPSAGYPAAVVALWKALERAGVGSLKRAQVRDFALATGISLSALKPHWNAGTD